MTTQVEQYLSSLEKMGRKPLTIRTYRKNLIQCQKVLEAHGRAFDATQIEPDDFVLLYNHMPQKEEVRKGYMRTLAQLCIFHTGQDPMKKAGILFNREQRQREFITDEEFQCLYESADPTMRMVLVLGACMGLRRAEIASIKDEDIRAGYLTVWGKGHGKGMRVQMCIPKRVEEELIRYHAWKSTKPNSGDGYLIQNGKVLSKIGLSTLSTRMTKLARSLGIRGTIHSLRRYYATTLYDVTGSDIVTVSKLMRHADVSTTAKCYINSSDRQEREAMNRLNEYVSSMLAEA